MKELLIYSSAFNLIEVYKHFGRAGCDSQLQYREQIMNFKLLKSNKNVWCFFVSLFKWNVGKVDNFICFIVNYVCVSWWEQITTVDLFENPT